TRSQPFPHTDDLTLAIKRKIEQENVSFSAPFVHGKDTGGERLFGTSGVSFFTFKSKLRQFVNKLIFQRPT
ncbi:hypothetical protein, partial [Lacticaseibacillus paracasei]|uniref:hypothetical protein n=1 Tax=Lacticaseibacillus paracasei TaxID=1597 RepID=UPI0005F1E238